jgi:hypothetical protein
MSAAMAAAPVAAPPASEWQVVLGQAAHTLPDTLHSSSVQDAGTVCAVATSHVV